MGGLEKKRNALHSEGWRTDPDGLSAHFQCWSLPSGSRGPLLTSHSSLEAAPTCWRAVRHSVNGWKARGRGQCLTTMHGRRGRRDVSSLYPFGLPGSLCRFVPLCVCDHVGAQTPLVLGPTRRRPLVLATIQGPSVSGPNTKCSCATLCRAPKRPSPRIVARRNTGAPIQPHKQKLPYKR